jgi:hypothetical protein
MTELIKREYGGTHRGSAAWLDCGTPYINRNKLRSMK